MFLVHYYGINGPTFTGHKTYATAYASYSAIVARGKDPWVYIEENGQVWDYWSASDGTPIRPAALRCWISPASAP